MVPPAVDVRGDVVPSAADTRDYLRPVGVLLGHYHTEEEVRIAAEQEAVRQEVIVDQLRPVSVLLGHDHLEEEVQIAAEQEAILPEVNVANL